MTVHELSIVKICVDSCHMTYCKEAAAVAFELVPAAKPNHFCIACQLQYYLAAP